MFMLHIASETLNKELKRRISFVAITIDNPQQPLDETLNNPQTKPSISKEILNHRNKQYS